MLVNLLKLEQQYGYEHTRYFITSALPVYFGHPHCLYCLDCNTRRSF